MPDAWLEFSAKWSATPVNNAAVRIAIQDIYPGHLGLAIHEHGWDSKLRDPVATCTARLGPGAGNHHYKPRTPTTCA